MAFATRAPSRPTQQGVTVWLTGLPSAGETTIANLVAERLVPADRAEALAAEAARLPAVVRDGRGLADLECLAVVDVEEAHDPDPAREAKLVFETDDPAHPGVAATLAQVRAEGVARGWRSLAGFQTRNPVHRALLDGYHPPGRVLLSAFPAAMRCAGPREAVFHALVGKNDGCAHFIVGRGALPPPQFSRPEVARLLADGYRAQRG